MVRDFTDLAFRVRELLTEGIRTIKHFEQGNHTYKHAIREITGRKRISEKESELLKSLASPKNKPFTAKGKTKGLKTLLNQAVSKPKPQKLRHRAGAV